MRDAILANVSHEFRTPLAAQLASIELLREQLPDLELDQVRELLFSIERGTLRLTQLIDNLLESVRIDAGQDSIRRQRVALDEVVEEAADMAAPLLALREQELEIDLPRPTPLVSGDRARLAQVFVNLLANANKFSPQASTIRVGARAEGAQVAIWVEDEGPGIPADEADVVFERFRRSTGEEPVESGMGLGLWIVKSIVERHGGSVEAASGAHAGARLIVRLPIAAAEAEAEVRT
jgi:signal transduction histidine kinase